MGSVHPPDLNAREWPFDRRFRALTYTFRVRSDIPGIGALVERLLASFVDSSHGAPISTYILTHRASPGNEAERRVNRYELFQDGTSIQRVANPGSMIDWVILDSTRCAVSQTDRFLAVHAGVVSLDGRAVLMSGPADSGKTTLVAGLTRAGFGFLGDEVALLEPRSVRVHPYFRPLMIEPASMEVLNGLESELPVIYRRFRGRRYPVAADDLRMGATGEACPVAYVVFPAYRAGSVTGLQPVSRASALIRLAEQTFNMSRLGKLGIQTLADVLEGAECFELPIGDLQQAIREVRGLFERGYRPVTDRARPGTLSAPIVSSEAARPSGSTR